MKWVKAIATQTATLRLAALLLSAVTATAAHAAPAAGTVILNTAQATYFDTDRGFNTKLLSNTVGITVQAQEALTLTADNNLRRAAVGIASMTHRLTNTGNTTSSYVVQYGNRTDANFNLLSLRLVRDLNGNGVADPGEPDIVSGSTLGPLASGDFVDLVLSGTVPNAQTSGNAARLDISARSVAQSIVQANIDTVTIADGALLQLFKATSNLAPRTGDDISFTLTASNTGNRPATGLPTRVDGVDTSLVLMRDVIPSNTRFAAFGAQGSNDAGLALYHLSGQAVHTYTRSAPADLSSVDAVAFGYAANLAPGRSVARNFAVKVNANANGPIINTAQVLFQDGVQPQPVVVDSNSVRMQVPERAPTLTLFSDPNYAHPTHAISAGQPFYVGLDASRCNADPLVAETKQINVTSLLGTDVEIYTALETGPNTGQFRIEPSVPTSDATRAALIRGDGTLSVRANDQLTISVLGCGVAVLQADLLVDPYGVVFNSKTNALVAGAVVSLIDVRGAGNGGVPGGLARVFMADGITRSPSVVTTGADGHYQFPLVAPSTYRLQVNPPSPFTFASTLAVSLLPADRVVDAPGSYGGTFDITAMSEPVHIDIPVDADSRAGFMINKTSSRKTVELGEFVDYQIKIKNVTGQLLGRIRVSDALPVGFAYLPQSVRLDGATSRLNASGLPEPEGGVGPNLVFNVGSLADNSTLTLSYRVRVGAGALQGDGINRAQAVSAGPLAKLSNESRVAVQVLRGVFTERGMLMGQVYADCNNNLLRDADEIGIAGVRLVLEDGTSVTTDRLGRYNLYGLRPITHVLKVDNTSLPFAMGSTTAASWAALSNRHAGDAGSRFVDMKNGDLQRADFAVKGCSADVLRAITERNASAVESDQNSETAREAGAAALLTKDPRVLPVADPKALPASGVVGGPVATRSTAAAALGSEASATKNKSGAPTALSDEAMASLNNQLAFLSPAPDVALDYAQTNVLIKGKRGSTLQLRLNDVVVDASRVGSARSLEAQDLQVVEYVGLNLQAGLNIFSLTQIDATSKATAQTIKLNVIAPGSLAKLRITAPAQALPADGSSAVKVLIETLDAAGVRVTTPTPVTLQSSRGRWKVRDLDLDEPGVQMFVEGGQLWVEFESPADAGNVLLQASANTLQAQANLNFVPALRPLLASGIVEGVLNLRKLSRTAVQPARTQDGFEQALQNVGSGFDSGRGNSAARAALYLKGKVLGDSLLTLAYDSDKDVRERLFRDIQPNEFYPVYGDDSTPGFDAQSTGRLYLRLERGKSYVLYGDFNTQPDAAAVLPLEANGKTAGVAVDAERLGAYSRSLNGVRAHVQNNDSPNSLTTFASQTTNRRVIEELPAVGTSGPYAVKRGLDGTGFQVNSEKVEILSRDRNQTGVVLRSQALTRFVDYEIDSLGGGVLLKAPLASLDVNFNPQSLRITYEVDSGGRATWVGGARARVAATDKVTLNAGVVRDSDPQHPLILQSAGGTVNLAPGVMLAAEVARTATLLDASSSTADAAAGTAQSGKAARIELRVEAERLKLQAQVVAASAGFDNPSASVTKNQQEATLKGSYQLSDKTTIKAEALRSTDLTTSARKDGQQLSVEHALNDQVRGEVGLRHNSGVPTNALAVAKGEAVSTSQTTVRAKLSAQLPALEKASAFIEYEQDLDDATRRSAALGGDYQVNSATRVYARYEFISSLGSQYGLNDAQQRNATVLGVQSEYAASANAFSEYRIRDALEGRQAEAAIGLRNRWKLGGGWALSTGYERIRSLNALPTSNGTNVVTNNAESLALTGGIEYTGSPLWKGAARLEVRDSPNSSSLLSTVGVSFKLNDEWTALGRNLVTINAQRNASRKTEDWFQAGLAYRQSTSVGTDAEAAAQPYRTNALMRMEYRTETTLDPLASDSARKVAIVSAHWNRQADAKLTLSSRAAAKWARDESLNLFSSYRTQLLYARAVYDLTQRWDAGLQTSALLGGAGRSRQLGLGLETGYRVANNLWLSVGWNVFGFTDRDLSAQDHTQRGAYLRLRFKFDETAF